MQLNQQNPFTQNIEAKYTEQRIPRYKGNQLIEALPPALDDDQLLEALWHIPHFAPEQREWPTHDRMQMVMELSEFMVPLPRHIELARHVDMLIRQGYVHRPPQSPEHVRVFQEIYGLQQAGKTFGQKYSTISSQYSTALIGYSGMGKTTIFKRILSLYPQVIFHPKLHLWQIPYLHIEIPSDGHSLSALAKSILLAVDRLIPGANYHDRYAMRGKPGVWEMMFNACRVLHAHSCGVLVCDEIQHLSNTPTNKQSLMSHLVGASNLLGLPLIFVGTNKARKILGMELSQARRSSGFGMQPWTQLQKGSIDEPDEWEDFLNVLWRHQWTRNPVGLDEHLSATLHYSIQHGPLFASCQWRAMLDGSETITPELIDAVWRSSFSLLHPMTEALRNNDHRALQDFEDIAPLNFETMLQNARHQYYGKRVKGASVAPGDEAFTPAIVSALNSMGVEPEQSYALAETIEAEKTVSNVLEGVSSAIKKMQPPRRTKASKGKDKEPAAVYDLDDYRRAIQAAKQQGTKIIEQMLSMGMAPNLEEILLVD